MKKLLALVLSMLLVASCFALVAVAAEETTAEETTEGAATEYVNTKVVFDENAKEMKVLASPNGIHKTLYKSEWEGARLKITDVGDPYLTINWSSYIKKAGLEKVDSQSYPFIVIKLKIEGYVDDFELFYSAGDIMGPDPAYATTTDYPCEGSGEIEYIIYDLTGDCEGTYNQFRFDPMGADEETLVYLYEMAMFATEDEAIAYAGLDQEPEETEPETTEAEVTTEEETEAEEEQTTKKPVSNPNAEKEKSCGGVISVGAIVAIISLGVVCIKKKD